MVTVVMVFEHFGYASGMILKQVVAFGQLKDWQEISKHMLVTQKRVLLHTKWTPHRHVNNV